MSLDSFAAELRKWWSFDDRQMHTHSWHSREDFIEKELPELLGKEFEEDNDRGLEALDRRDAEIERLRERCEAYKGQVKAGATEIERLRALIRGVSIALARDENVDGAMKLIVAHEQNARQDK